MAIDKMRTNNKLLLEMKRVYQNYSNFEISTIVLNLELIYPGGYEFTYDKSNFYVKDKYRNNNTWCVISNENGFPVLHEVQNADKLFPNLFKK